MKVKSSASLRSAEANNGGKKFFNSFGVSCSYLFDDDVIRSMNLSAIDNRTHRFFNSSAPFIAGIEWEKRNSERFTSHVEAFLEESPKCSANANSLERKQHTKQRNEEERTEQKKSKRERKNGNQIETKTKSVERICIFGREPARAKQLNRRVMQYQLLNWNRDCVKETANAVIRSLALPMTRLAMAFADGCRSTWDQPLGGIQTFGETSFTAEINLLVGDQLNFGQRMIGRA